MVVKEPFILRAVSTRKMKGSHGYVEQGNQKIARKPLRFLADGGI